MKNYYLRILFLFICINFISFSSKIIAQTSYPTFENAYGLKGEEEATTVLPTQDGYLVLGTTKSFEGNSDIFLMKINENGRLIWTQKYGNESNEVAWNMTLTKDNHILICGTTETNGNNQQSLFLKVKQDGTILWQKVYTNNAYNVPVNALLLENGNFLITGYLAFDVSTNTRDCLAMELSKNGEIIWSKSYDTGSSGNEYFLQAMATKNGNYVIATALGSRKYTPNGLYDNTITCIDKNGNLVWGKHFGGEYNDAYRAIAHSKGNQFVVAGGYRTSENNYNMAFSFLNQEGDIENINYFGKHDFDRVFGIASTKDKKFHLLVGSTTSFGKGKEDGLALLIDNKANYIDSQTFGGNNDDVINWAIPTNDNKGFILVGKTKSFGTGQSDIYITRMNFDSQKETIQTSCNAEKTENVMTSLNLEVKDFRIDTYTPSFGEGTPVMQNEVQFDTQTLCCSQSLLDAETLPNVITPNADGKNDYLVFNLEEGTEAAITIYNRWGKKVFEADKYQNDWNAKGLTTGSYYGTLTISCTGQKLKFWVSVIKN